MLLYTAGSFWKALAYKPNLAALRFLYCRFKVLLNVTGFYMRKVG